VSPADTPVLDLRTYQLVPGGGGEFDRIFRERALPMLERHGIEIVGYGPSLDDADLYFLVRAFPSAARRDEQLAAFYGSDEWLQNHRDAVLALIEGYHTLLVPIATIHPPEPRRISA
jgi:NIPSNAP